MAADWIGINSSHYDSDCGHDGNNTVSAALDGTGYWQHYFNHTHFFIVDLGETYNVSKVKGRSNRQYDPVEVNIYVSDDKENWGAAVATGIDTWQDTNDFVEINTTPKVGQFIKVEIIETEDVSEHSLIFGAHIAFSIFDVYGEVAAPIIIIPSTLQLALIQQTPTISVDCTVTPATFELALTQQTPTISVDCIVTPDTFELALTLLNPVILAGIEVVPDTFEIALFQETPSILFPVQTVLPDTFEIALTQETPSVIIDCTVTPATFEIALTQETPETISETVVTPDTFELALTQHSPSLSFDYIVTPTTFEIALELLTPTIVIIGDIIVYPDAFEIALEQPAPSISIRFIEIPSFMEKDLIDLYSGGAWLWLCEFAVPGQAKIWIARNTENVLYDGKNFEKFNFQIGEQVFSGDGSIPRVTLQIFQDLNRKIEDIVNETEGALGAAVKLIRVNEKFLNTPVAALEADYENLASESNTEWVTFTLGVPNPLTQRFPLRLDSYSGCPWATPSLFKGPRCQYTGSDTSCTGTFNDCYLKGNAVHWGAELGLDPNVVRV